MAQTSWPYAGDSVEEPEWISMSRLWRGSGVIDGADAELEVTEVTGQLQVSVATGEAWLEGFYYANDTAATLNLDTADLNDPRIDLVVVRSDRTAGTARLAVITGTPAAAPVAPTVTQDHDVAGVFEIALAEVRVGAAASNVDGQVTDRRSFSLKPAAVSDTAPADPAVDQLWYDSSVDLLKRWTGTTWVAAGNAAYVAKLDDRPLVSTAVATYYLDQAAGSDTNDGLTAATAFASWGKAWSMVPRFVRHNTEIRIVGNYTGGIEIEGVVHSGGSLSVQGDSGVAANHTIVGKSYINGAYGRGYVDLRFLYLRFSSDIEPLKVTGSVGFGANTCEFRNNGAATPPTSGIRIQNAIGWVRSCDFGTSQFEQAITVYATARVMSYSNTGAATAYGLYSYLASTIGKYSTQPTGGTANEYANLGGVIR